LKSWRNWGSIDTYVTILNIIVVTGLWSCYLLKFFWFDVKITYLCRFVVYITRFIIWKLKSKLMVILNCIIYILLFCYNFINNNNSVRKIYLDWRIFFPSRLWAIRIVMSNRKPPGTIGWYLRMITTPIRGRYNNNNLNMDFVT